MAAYSVESNVSTDSQTSEMVVEHLSEHEFKRRHRHQSSQSPSSSSPASGSRRADRNQTWITRFDQQKASHKHLQHALKLARTEQLKSGLRYLVVVNHTAAVPHEIAHFLHANQDCLDKTAIGDFLGELESNLLDKEGHDLLRTAFIQRLDFTSMSFDAALRAFLCDSGFRLPVEAQKIDRMLESFCVAYTRDNPGVFRNSSSAFIVSFALVMLNTDIHDPRLRTNSSSRARKAMTLQEFINNLRQVDDGHDFPKPFLTALYQSIARAPIEWKDASAASSASSSGAASINIDGADDREISQAARKAMELMTRKALAYLKTQSASLMRRQTPTSPHLVAAMFELSWFSFIAAISSRENSRDVEVLHACLDGLGYGTAIAIMLGLPTERQAFARILAKITFVETYRADHPDSKVNAELPKLLIMGEHLQQDWYKPLELQCENAPEGACKMILEVGQRTKLFIAHEQRQSILRRIQADFGGDVMLLDPGRQFLRSGKLVKLSQSNNKKTEYKFYLFNDLLIYASEGLQVKYKVHRVLQLVLCRLLDCKDDKTGFSFKVCSPQKSVIIHTTNRDVKQEWMSALAQAIKKLRHMRRRYVQSGSVARQRVTSFGRAEEKKAVGITSEEKLRRLSTFIGQSLGTAPPSLSSASSSVPSTPSSSSSMAMTTPKHARAAANLHLSPHITSPSTATTASSSSSLSASPSGKGKLPPPQQLMTHCRLCLKPYAMFRRRVQCPFCFEQVCGDCLTQKCRLELPHSSTLASPRASASSSYEPSSPIPMATLSLSSSSSSSSSLASPKSPRLKVSLQKVCDACSGVLNGQVSDDIPVITQEI